jgi:molecular chaperone GrpE
VTAASQQHNQNLLPPADWAGEFEKLQEELAAERDRTLRTLADFKNFRRRIEREGNKFAEEGERRILVPLLDIIDDMDKALKWAGDEDQPVVQGLNLTRQKLLALLESHGVVPFESVGKQFNHDLHEAVALAEDEGTDPGTVVDELRRGYLWNNELLRPAQVRVAK